MSYTKQCLDHNQTATYSSMEKRWICPECPKGPIEIKHEKSCNEHNKKATYCSIEKRWICSECPINKIFKETKFLQTEKW